MYAEILEVGDDRFPEEDGEELAHGEDFVLPGVGVGVLEAVAGDPTVAVRIADAGEQHFLEVLAAEGGEGADPFASGGDDGDQSFFGGEDREQQGSAGGHERFDLVERQGRLFVSPESGLAAL